MSIKLRVLVLLVSVGILPGGSIPGQEKAAEGQGEKLPFRIFDREAKLVVVNGYSTSFEWWKILQRKVDRVYGGERVLEVVPALQGGTPIAKWMDVKTGRPLKPWEQKITPALKDKGKRKAIVLCQQSLQWAFGERQEGIRGKEDAERIKAGADALEKYVTGLKQDGADMVVVAMHIYKQPMEPTIGNERLALAALLERKIAGVYGGPDVWAPTKKYYPAVFAGDKLHPNQAGAEIMAQYWFERLLELDGRRVPPASRREMEEAVRLAVGEIIATRDIVYARTEQKDLRVDEFFDRVLKGE